MAAKIRVLIVDDDPSLRNILTHMLKAMHYELAGVATSAQEAEEQALALKPDVIIMDVVMETRRAGIQAATKIAESIHIPIIYLTTDVEEETLIEALATEPFGYLLKPIQPDNLRAAIEISMLRFREEISMRIYQEALEEANHLFKGIFSTMQNGYYRVNLEEKIMLANPAFLDILGYGKEENLTGKSIEELGFTDGASRKELLDEVHKNGFVHMHESEWHHQNGSPISILENVQAFYDESDTLQYYEGTVQDITPMRVLQQQLQLSQKMEIIGTMASRIAHELNNKLTTILGYADLCAIKLPKEHEIYKYIQHIQNYSKHSAGVIQQLLKFSRKPEAQEPTSFDVVEFLHERREIIEAICTRTITVLTQSEMENSIVFADKKQFEQVIINLVINARDAMPDGGTLTFKLTNESYEQSSRNSRVAPHGDYIKISLMDTGAGIPAKNLIKIFEPFFTTKKEGVGTGLGLSIVKGIIESNKGFIQVSSTIDVGTTFEILLPVSRVDR